MPERFPDPTRRYPVTLPDGTEHRGTVFLDQVIDHPAFSVGAFTYASDFDPPEDWAAHLAPYLFAQGQERLRIGRFCAIAHGVRFITSGANHAMDGITTYPFQIFDLAHHKGFQPDQRDTVIGHDVWLGYGALVLPGAQIGNGAIIGAGAVVGGQVPDYAIVTGNPARVLRLRFSDRDIARLLRLAWWHWPVSHVAAARTALMQHDLDALEALAPRM